MLVIEIVASIPPSRGNVAGCEEETRQDTTVGFEEERCVRKVIPGGSNEALPERYLLLFSVYTPAISGANHNTNIEITGVTRLVSM